MPVKIRDSKALKASKENACVKLKKNVNTDKNLRPQRKVLGDKTNSASDDNASILTCEPQLPKTAPLEETAKACNIIITETIERPKRARRVPTRYIENNCEKVNSKKSNSPSVNTNYASPKQKVPIVLLTPLKIPHETHDSSIIINRPKRICRLPSKFDNSSTSPSKFLTVQPVNSSTPLAPKTKSVKQAKRELRSKTVSEKKLQPKKLVKKVGKRKLNEAQAPQKSPKQSQITSFLKKKLPDTNNNANINKNKSLKAAQNSPDTKRDINKSKAERNKIRDIDWSIKVLDDKKSLKRNSNKADVYEFTFDPSEEPPPAKKQKKKNVSKKPPKPRKVTYKSNYEKNLAKALAVLKNTVAPDKVLEQNHKEANDQASSSKNPESNQFIAAGHKVDDKTQRSNRKNDVNQTSNRDIGTNAYENVENNCNSVRVEDTAFDVQPDTDNLNYSPVNTPTRSKTPKCNAANTASIDDPLNAQELSFFDEQPAASSSMNQSIRHPTASPWRIEFGNLPIKWQVNTYVKPNMTPALESSYMNFNDTKKKHVYTPIVPVNETLPEITESPNLKQTSIMSFIKEVVERSANKKKKKSSPMKNNSLFEDVTHSFVNVENTPTKETLPSSKTSRTPNKGVLEEINANVTNTNNDSSVEDKENDSKSNENNTGNDKNLTFFGFDESEDQENASPTKKKLRSTKSKNRRALQELNTFKGPTRPVLPVAAKTKILQNIDKANELYENMKSATEPPVFPEISIAGNTEVTNVNPTEDNEDSQSVHLFEDIEVVHHHKPIRKSYSKPKRVMFRQRAVEDSDDSRNTDDESSGQEMDESFTLPTIQIKKPTKKRVTKKQKLSKKEEKEAEAWAAGFNSMCENIEEFELVVE